MEFLESPTLLLALRVTVSVTGAILFAFTLILALFILLALFLLSTYFARIAIGRLGKMFIKKQFVGLLEPKDAIFIATDPTLYSGRSDQVVPILLTLQGHFEMEQFKRWIQDSLLREQKNFARLFQHPKQWMGFSFWAWDQNFCLDYHIRVIPITHFGDAQVEQFVTAHVQDPFQANSSPWEIILAPHSKNQMTTLLLFRIHHSLCDGPSIFKILEALTGNQQRGGIHSAMSGCGPSQLGNALNAGDLTLDSHALRQELAGKFKTICSLPFKLSQATKGLKTIDHWLAKNEDAHMSQTTTTLAQVQHSKTISFSSTDLEYAQQTLKVTSAAIINCALSRAISDYLRTSEAEAESGPTTRSDSNLSICFVYSLPRKNTQDYHHQLRNDYGTGIVSLNLKANSLADNLKLSQNCWNWAREPCFLKTLDCLLNMIGALPTALSSLILKDGGSKIVMSIMNGPENSVSISTNTSTLVISDIMFWVTPRSPLGISVLSYNGQVRVGISAHHTFIRNSQQLNTFSMNIEQQVQRILALARTVGT